MTTDSPHRIILWGTGFVGTMVLAEVLDNPAWELAGVIVNDPAKHGRDVGDLVGRPTTGLTASTDADDILSRDADAVAYYGPTAEFAGENIRNICAALRAGKDVVSTAMTPWVYPAVCDDHEIEAVRNACIEGRTSCFTTGIDPGFANDLFPLTVMGVCGRVDSVRIQEILNYDSYTGSYDPMGFGKPLEHRALLETTDILVYAWGRTIPMIADAMGIELDGIDSVYDKWAAPADIPTAQGAIPAGTCGAVRFEIRGMVGGQPRIVIEHVNRMGIDAAPDWPRGSMEDDDVYRIEITGSPNVTQETAFRREADGDPNGGGCLATGMRALNCVPAVIAAPPGLLSPLDLPIQPGVGVLRP